jgi:hypothetical protein
MSDIEALACKHGVVDAIWVSISLNFEVGKVVSTGNYFQLNELLKQATLKTLSCATKSNLELSLSCY